MKALEEYKRAQEHAQNFLVSTFMGENAQRRNLERNPEADHSFNERFGKLPREEKEEWIRWWLAGYDSALKESGKKPE
jgi:hypothetical protein